MRAGRVVRDGTRGAEGLRQTAERNHSLALKVPNPHRAVLPRRHVLRFRRVGRQTPQLPLGQWLGSKLRVSSRDGSRWKSVRVIESEQQRVFQVVGSCWELLGATGSR